MVYGFLEKWGAHVVNTTKPELQHRSNIQVLQDGSFVTAWIATDMNAQTSKVFARITDASGNPIGTEFQINTTDIPVMAGKPEIVLLENGNFLVAWVNEGATGKYLLAQVFDNNGTPVGAELRLDETGGLASNSVTFSPVTGGGFLATWDDIYPGTGLPTAVVGRFFDNNGSPTSEVIKIAPESTEDQLAPKVVELTDGSFIVAYSNTGSNEV